MFITHGTLVACISPPALILLYILPALRAIWAYAVVSSNLSHMLHCSHSIQTMGSASMGSYLLIMRNNPNHDALRFMYLIHQKGDVRIVAILKLLQLTTLWHHALLYFENLCSTNGAICRGHLYYAFSPLHAMTTCGTADIPFGPLCNQATAGS